MVKDLQIQPPAPTQQTASGPQYTPRTDFDAGRLFARYDNAGSGQLSREQFHHLLQDLNTTSGGGFPAGNAPGPAVPQQLASSGQFAPAFGHVPAAALDSNIEFEHGRLFQKYDATNAGSLSQDQFRAFIHDVRRGSLPPPAPSGPGPAARASGGHAAPQYGPWSTQPAPPQYGSGAGVYGRAMSEAGTAMVPGGYGAADMSGASDVAMGSLSEAFHTRMHSLSVAHANLMAKREAMLYQLARLRSRAEEVAAARRSVERETMADTEAMLHRLRSAEALKQSILRHDMDVLAGDIAAIDRFAGDLSSHSAVAGSEAAGAAAGDHDGTSAVQTLANRGHTMVQGQGLQQLVSGGVQPQRALGFMREYPALCSEADRLLAKHVKQDIAVSSEDFERETASRLALVDQVAALRELNDSKTSVIEALLREREAAAADVAAITQASNDEVQQWVELTDKLTAQLARFQKGQHMAANPGEEGAAGSE